MARDQIPINKDLIAWARTRAGLSVAEARRNLPTSRNGKPEKAAAMANHASTRTTQLYDRRSDEVSLDEVERISI